MEGRATFTMVMSMMFMNIAVTKTTLTLIFGLMWIRGTTRTFQPVCSQRTHQPGRTLHVS
jgi:hypothetical protein